MTTVKSLLESLDRTKLLRLANCLSLIFSERATHKFMVKRIEDVLLNSDFSWVLDLPQNDIQFIKKLVEKGADSEESALTILMPPLPYICIELNLVVSVQSGDNPDEFKCWIPKDLLDALKPEINDILDEYSNSPYYLIDSLFWGLLFNYGIIEKQEFVDYIYDFFESDEFLDEALLYAEEYIPLLCLKDPIDEILCPFMTIDDVDFYDSIINKELEEHPHYSIKKILFDGSSYPYPTASPIYYEPYFDEDEVDDVDDVGDVDNGDDVELMRYSNLFLDKSHFDSFLLILYFNLQKMDSFTENDVNRIVDHFSTPYPDIVVESCTHEVLKEAVRDIILNIPILKLKGYTLGFVKDMELEFDEFDEFDDEFDDTFVERPSLDAIPKLKKVGPYELCPCGSGLMYMHCHGKMTMS